MVLDHRPLQMTVHVNFAQLASPAIAPRPNRETRCCYLQQGYTRQELFDEMERLMCEKYDMLNDIESHEEVDCMNSELITIVNEALVNILDRSPLYTETR